MFVVGLRLLLQQASVGVEGRVVDAHVLRQHVVQVVLRRLVLWVDAHGLQIELLRLAVVAVQPVLHQRVIEAAACVVGVLHEGLAIEPHLHLLERVALDIRQPCTLEQCLHRVPVLLHRRTQVHGERVQHKGVVRATGRHEVHHAQHQRPGTVVVVWRCTDEVHHVVALVGHAVGIPQVLAFRIVVERRRLQHLRHTSPGLPPLPLGLHVARRVPHLGGVALLLHLLRLASCHTVVLHPLPRLVPLRLPRVAVVVEQHVVRAVGHHLPPHVVLADLLAAAAKLRPRFE